MFSFWKTLLPILGKGNKKDRLLCLKKYNNLIVFLCLFGRMCRKVYLCDDFICQKM